MSSAAKLRKYGRGTATVAAAALVMTSFGPAAFASWDNAPQTPNVDLPRASGTIGIVDTAPGQIAGDQKTLDVSAVSPDPAAVNRSNIDASPVQGETRDENQGARLVYAGKTGQAIADVQLVLPNRFVSGDILDLRLLDRSATEHSDGLSNKSADTLVGFTGTEGVTVEVSQAMDPRTTVNSDTDAVDTSNPRVSGNTATSMLPWTTGTNTVANPQRATAPGAAPSLSAPQVSQSNNVQGKDNLRLSVTNQSTGDPDAVWVVTIKGLKVDLGAKATPGELRLVPFLSNAGGSGDSYTASPWFNGNAKFDNNGTPSDLTDDTPREIGIYTVPAYVSPVTVTSTQNQIVADGLSQSIGDVTVAETQPFSLQNGVYTIDFSDSGADVEITSLASAMKATVANGGASETVTNITVANDRKSLSFTLNGADDAKASSITFSGLMLTANRAGNIEFNVRGGSIDANGTNHWLATPAGTSTLEFINPTGASVYSDTAFVNWNGTLNQPGVGTESRTITTPASVSASRSVVAQSAPTLTPATVNGSDVLPAGNYLAVSANRIEGSGAAAGVILTRSGATNTWTATWPAAHEGASGTDTYTIGGVVSGSTFTVTGGSSFSVTGPASIASGTGTPPMLPYGTYTFSDTNASAGSLSVGDRYSGNGIVLEYSSANTLSVITGSGDIAAGDTYALTTPTNANIVIAGPTFSAQSGPTRSPITVTNLTTATDYLPAGTYTVSADGQTISGAGVTLTRDGATDVFTVSGNTSGAAVTSDKFLVTGATNGMQFVMPGASASVTSVLNNPTGFRYGGNGNIPTGTYYVSRDATASTTAGADRFDIGTTPGDDDVFNDIAIATNATPVGVATGTFQFSGLADGVVFEIQPGTGLPVADIGVNQKDILAPVSELTQLGVATSQSARIGGNNRYETAAKVAEQWAEGDKSNTHGKVRNAIIALGENFPDALSASYLSQRMGAPILLVQRNSIPQDTIEALRDRQVDKVFIVGGPAAVSQNVQEQLANLNTYRYDTSSTPALETTGAKLSVQRLSSANPQNDTRYTTNQLVNMYAAAWGGQRTIGKTVYKSGEAGKYTAIFARGDNFPDALAAGVLTAGIRDRSVLPVNISNDNALPLVLTQPGELSASAKALIENLDIEHGLIIGSENAVSDSVKKSIEDMGLTNTRIGGEDRYFTAAAVDEFAMRPAAPSATNEYPGLGFIGTSNTAGEFPRDVTAYLANGLKFPDALTAAPWVGRAGNVLNLTEGAGKLSNGTTDFLTKRAADVDRAIALGLGDAVNTTVLNEANKIASSK